MLRIRIMKKLLLFLSFAIVFSQQSSSSLETIDQLIHIVESANRNGQVVWAEEFSGLT